MYIRYFILIVACILCLPATAQNKKKYSKSEFRAKKQAYMADKAGLSKEESKNFFPLYFEFQDKKKEINKDAWGTAKKGVNPETTDQGYKEIIDNFFTDQEEIAKLEKVYIEKYRKILSDKKIYMLYWAELKFSRNMLKILQEMDENE